MMKKNIDNKVIMNNSNQTLPLADSVVFAPRENPVGVHIVTIQ